MNLKNLSPKKSLIWMAATSADMQVSMKRPRELLHNLPDIEIVEMKNNRDLAVCCGGPFVAAYPELAKKFAAKRIRDAINVGAEVIAVACPTCLLNLKEGAKDIEGAKIDIQEVVSLVQKSVKK